MPIIRCPHCDDRVEIEDDWYGRRIACPNCDRQFTPKRDDRDDREDDRPRRRSSRDDRDDDRDAGDRKYRPGREDDRPRRRRSRYDAPPKKGNAVLWIVLALVGVFVVLPCVGCLGLGLYAQTAKQSFDGPWADHSVAAMNGGGPAVTASFPKPPVSRGLADTVNNGSGTALGFSNMDQDGSLKDAIFVIGYVDYPAGTVNPLDRGYLEVRKQVEEAYMDNPLVPPTVASEITTTVGGYPAKEATYSKEDGSYTLRVVHVNDRPRGAEARLVVIAAGGTGMKDEDKQKFLNSVKIGKK